jgi:hypothetical protein
VLAALGLDPREDSLYRYLAGALPATSEEVWTAMEFVHRVAGDPVRFAAASPGTLAALVTGKLAGLRQAQETLSELSGRYTATHLAMMRGIGDFEVIYGAEACGNVPLT